jgi:hypothetical protein
MCEYIKKKSGTSIGNMNMNWESLYGNLDPCEFCTYFSQRCKTLFCNIRNIKVYNTQKILQNTAFINLLNISTLLLSYSNINEEMALCLKSSIVPTYKNKCYILKMIFFTAFSRRFYFFLLAMGQISECHLKQRLSQLDSATWYSTHICSTLLRFNW